MNKTFAPSILTSDGGTIIPTGIEWLLAFTIRGQKWAEPLLEEAIENQRQKDIENTLGSGI